MKPKKKNNRSVSSRSSGLQKNVGTFFIILSLFGFFTLFFPYLQTFFPKPELKKIPDGLAISIPRIHAQSPIVVNVDPWDVKAYSQALKHGVAHAKGTGIPGESKHSFLFAHSSGLPWEILHTNTAFLSLNELETGDAIYIYNNHKRISYQVFEKKVVSARDVAFLTHGQDNTLTLQTCWPIGTDWQRLLILARLEKTAQSHVSS